MDRFRAPVSDVQFVLDHIVRPADLAAYGGAAADDGTIATLLEEAGRFAQDVVAPTNRDGDTDGARINGDDVITPASFRQAYEQYVAAGWGAVSQPEDLGGGGFPLLVSMPIKEFITSANMALSLCPMLTSGAVYLLHHHASQIQRQRYGPKLVTGEWAGTMNLTEPQAGSDVGAVTTRAEPVGDGTYRVTGQKIFITFGDHDLTEQIVHLVLARLPDAPAGTKGLSLFIVPKFRVTDDGRLGERNDVYATALEHKLGIHGSPTCVMTFGERQGGAVGELIGEPHHGMAQMFTMMNDARLAVGLQGVAIAERAYQQAVEFARTRLQGRLPGGNAQVAIIEHADVRRMLLTQRAGIDAARALCYFNAYAIDRSGAGDTGARHYQQLADLLTPLSKAWSTDLGVELTSLALQVHGGMGFVEETGVAQHVRDARIAPIYEGTNGIQAIDLVTRKVPMDGGAPVRRLLAEIRHEAGRMGDVGAARASVGMGDLARHLVVAVGTVAEATDWLLDRRDRPNEVLAGASPYLRALATLVGGHLLAKSAVAACDLLERGQHERYTPAYLRSKVHIAKFYIEQLLPSVDAHCRAVVAGSGDLFAIDADALSAR